MKPITACRICGSNALESVVDLGWQALSGIFLSEYNPESFPGGPLRLVRCNDVQGCGLVQLEQSFDPNIMYGDNYGYRSGLNSSMVQHLERRVRDIENRIEFQNDDVVIDIGSNDGTTLAFYPLSLTRIGVDPTANKYRKYYPQGAIAVAEFFTSQLALSVSGGRLAKAITSVSMMYDLEDPCNFVREVASVLARDGIWMFEQSYLPLMLERVAFDTICHEHIEYYGLRQIDWLMKKSGLEVIDVELNDVNGGSFAVTAAHRGVYSVSERVEQVREGEKILWENASAVFVEFALATRARADALHAFVIEQIKIGKTVAGLGASTKGNVLLQYSGLNCESISMIGDVNTDKHGCVTPGTWIPIVSEAKVLEQDFDFYIVLPWHFREFFLKSLNFKGRQLVFPLPKLEIVKC